MVIPGHPGLRLRRQLSGVPLQGREVIEWIDPAQLAGVDQAHEHVADMSPAGSLVEQGVLAMENRLLQRLLANIVIQR